RAVCGASQIFRRSARGAGRTGRPIPAADGFPTRPRAASPVRSDLRSLDLSTAIARRPRIGSAFSRAVIRPRPSGEALDQGARALSVARADSRIGTNASRAVQGFGNGYRSRLDTVAARRLRPISRGGLRGVRAGPLDVWL